MHYPSMRQDISSLQQRHYQPQSFPLQRMQLVNSGHKHSRHEG